MALDSFALNQLKFRMDGIQQDFCNLQRQVNEIDKEVEEVKKRVDNLANFQMRNVRGQVIKVLGDAGCATPENADIVSLFVSSIGSHITSLFFKGVKRNSKFSSRYRGVLYNTMAPEEILRQIEKMRGLSKITGGTISTGCITTAEDLKACALAIAAFVKIASLFEVDICPISSDKPTSPSDECMSIRFEGQYTLSEFKSITKQREERGEILQSMRKNVYILGSNGAGKSSWGNLISDSNTFEIGTGTHTTMDPQSFDVQAAYEFRLWDTPGLFDGSEQQCHMQDHMKYRINYNGYCSAVLFVFNRCTAPNAAVNDMLKFAVENIGDFVRDNFIAILNDEGEHAEDIYPSYCERLDEKGFVVKERNVILSSAKRLPNEDVFYVRQKLSSFETRLVRKHRQAYEDFLNSHEDIVLAVRRLFEHGKDELLEILRQGKVSTVRYRENGPSDMTRVPRDVIRFQQNALGFLRRKIKLGRNSIVQEKSIKLRGSSKFITLITAKMNAEYTIAEAHLFTRHILPNKKYILIHTPRGECDYELWDTTEMKKKDVQDIVARSLLESRSA